MAIKNIKSTEYLGVVSLVTSLGASDVGTATLEDGKDVYISWGRNLSKAQVERMQESFTFDFVKGSSGHYEVIIPDEAVKELLPLIDKV